MTDLLNGLQGGLPQRYQLSHKLAEGGMSTVYVARESHPERDVVVKFLKESLEGKVGRDRFLREVDIASKLTHPNVVPIFSAGEAGSHLYYVMPYIAGESLAQRLKREGPLGLGEALEIAIEVAGALDYAHGQNVVHRDIKPGNILLLDGHAFVTDFGIARALSVASDDSATTEGVTLGTPFYMSPEQITESSTVDGRSDIYALGCVVYEMLTGEPPFVGATARTVLARQVVDPPPPVRTLRTTVPTQLEEVLTRALQKSPADRHQGARELRQALRDVQMELSNPAITGPAPPRTGSSRSKARRLISATGVLALVVAAIVWLTPDQPLAVADDGVFRHSVAVMPFENLSGDEQFVTIGKIIAEGINAELTSLQSVKVIWRASVERQAESGATIAAIADTFAVRHVITGTMAASSESLFVTASLVDAEAEFQVWSGTFAGALDDPYATQSDIANRIASQYASSVGLHDTLVGSSLLHGPGQDLYLIGRDFLNSRTEDGMVNAIDAFTRAIEANPGYATAITELAAVYTLALTYRYDVGVPEYQAAGMALALTARSLEIDSNYAKTFGVRGYLASIAQGPLQMVESDFGIASRLSPNDPSIPRWRARALSLRGLADSALVEAQRAILLDPNSSSNHVGVAMRAFESGRYELAIEAASHAIDLVPDLLLPRAIAARAMLMLGRPADCLSLDLGPLVATRASCLHASGRVEEAHAMIESVSARLMARAPYETHTSALRVEDLAAYYAWIGDPARSLHWLELAFLLSPSGVDGWLLDSPFFAAMWSDATFSREARRIRENAWARVVEVSTGLIADSAF